MTSVDTFKALKSGGREHVLWPRPFPAGGQLSSWSYLIFVSNTGNAVRVKFLVECKKIQKNEKITVLGKYVVNLRTLRV